MTENKGDISAHLIKKSNSTPGYLGGNLLIAMPHISEIFHKSLVFLCAHDDSGAMGLIINRPLIGLKLSDLLQQMTLAENLTAYDAPIYRGGPLESNRGFVLHTLDYTQNETITVGSGLGITATLNMLSDIAKGSGPEKSLLILGYARWDAGQLENELLSNYWLHLPSDFELLFEVLPNLKWSMALKKLGISAAMLSSHPGKA